MALVALHSSATGLSALSTQLDVIAHNLANVNTQGFKASRVNFQDLIYQEKALPGTENARGDRRPTGLYVGLGVKVSGTQLDFSLGAPIDTGRELDWYIDGEGFFPVRVDDNQAPGGVAYTRAGNFAVNADGEIVLATDQGRRLEPRITVPPDATLVQIEANGEVFAKLPGEAEPASLGRVEVASFVNPQGLEQLGENLFAVTAGSGPAITGNPSEEGFGQIRGGFLENSNVDATRELIELIRTQRAFEMNSQAIRAADDTLRAASQLRR